MKKFLIGAAALATAAAPLAASAQPSWQGHGGPAAERYDHRGGGGDRAGAVLAAGLFGFILGAAITSSAHDNDYNYGYRDADYGYGNGYGYTERCRWETQAVRGPWGRTHYEQVQVCR